MARKEIGNMMDVSNKQNHNDNYNELYNDVTLVKGKFGDYYTRTELDQKMKENVGKSAYEIAVENGFTGTAQEWLDSFQVVNGKSAYEVAVDNGFVGTEQEWLTSLGISTEEVEAMIKPTSDVYRSKPGTTGSEDAVNTIIGYKGNAIADGIRGSHVQQGSYGNENVIGGDPSTVGTATPNVVDPTKNGAFYAFIGGYDNVNNALAGTLMGYHCYISDLATHGAIYGGSYHKILDGDYAFIGAGTKNEIKNTDGGNYGYIVSGSTNKLFGRFGGILGGMNNRIGTDTANKNYSGIIGSDASTVDGNYATVLNGKGCKATKDFSFARGNQAVANNVGESVFSTGKFKTVGDSGQSSMHLLRQTTTGVETQLLLDDSGSAILTPIGVNTTLTVTGTVSAHRVDAEGYAGFKFSAVLGRTSGSLTLLGVNVETIYSSDPAYSMNVKAVSSYSSYQIVVKGVEGHTLNWTCKLDTVWSRNT